MFINVETMDNGFLVIGAGLPQTGTLSLMYALEILFPGKECFHGLKAHRNEDEWCKLMCGKSSDEEFEHLLQSNNYVAAVGTPFCFFYDRALKAFPNAKVILTTRKAIHWVKSFETISRAFHSYSYIPVYIINRLFPNYMTSRTPDRSLKRWSNELIDAHQKLEKVQTMEKAVDMGKRLDFFSNWEQEVKSNVPDKRLLVFDLKEGWNPLCEFLDIPVPNVPFPYVNRRDTIISNIFRCKEQSWVLLYELVTIPLFIFVVVRLTK